MFKKRLLAMFLPLLIVGAPSANALLIDGFGDTQGPVTDNTIDATAVTDGPTAFTDTDLSSPLRTLSADLTLGTEVELGINTAGNGWLNYSQNTGSRGVGMVDYSFDSVDMSTLAGAILIEAIELDTGLGNELHLVLELEDSTTASDSLTKTFILDQTFTTVPYSFASFGGVDLTSIVGASLTIDGSNSNSIDVAIDFIEAPVPEPSTLTLFGGALLGLGLLGRRRNKRKLAA